MYLSPRLEEELGDELILSTEFQVTWKPSNSWNENKKEYLNKLIIMFVLEA